VNVPLFFVGLGDAHEIRDIYLHDLQVEDNVYVNDKLIFELYDTVKGYPKGLNVPVTLRLKSKDGKPAKDPNKDRDKQNATADPSGKLNKVQLKYVPTEPGEYTFVVEAQVDKGLIEADKLDADKLKLERTVRVLDSRLIRILYVEG